MSDSRRRHLPLILALALLWVLLAILAAAVRRKTGGLFVYALDDAYIHMAMARNLAARGVWGLDPGHFSNTSSSPLWTLLLALDYRLFGANLLGPLLLNVLFASVLLVVIHFALLRHGAGPVCDGIALLAVLLWTPLPSLIFTGQEHVLHILLCLGFLLALRPHLVPTGRERAWPLLGLAALLPLVRYEGLFLCAAAFAALFLLGRKRTALLLLAAAVGPIAVEGIISLSFGWFFLPNPILLKGNLLHAGSWSGMAEFLRYGYRQAVTSPHMLALLLLTLGVFLRLRPTTEDRRERPEWILLGIFAVTLLLHLQFARLRWFYRYEAYLMAVGIFLLALALVTSSDRLRIGFLVARSNRAGRVTPRSWTAAVLAGWFLGLFPILAFSDRAAEATTLIPRACGNIWEQQIQIARFFSRFYPGDSVAANDLGAISYFGNVHALDLWGLSSMEVARSRLSGSYDRQVIADLANEHGCRVAALYQSWFAPGEFGGIPRGRPGGLPQSWIRVGSWTISDNLVGGDATVSFFGLSHDAADSLRARLEEFSSSLPRSVEARLEPEAGSSTR